MLASATGGVKKPHCFRLGTVALREIRKYQKSIRAFDWGLQVFVVLDKEDNSRNCLFGSLLGCVDFC
ncbi:hypothetical protein Patl1_30286 [Pistacia atlantica]|uniref:Uncharacterized protein n=1 Tax=Pistacia atlantica TaxID=434234 RepID=A0ACC1ACT9_9ROSI|nr:hypothetical protein Patl1_30286 [Pistacia atlantica]